LIASTDRTRTGRSGTIEGDPIAAGRSAYAEGVTYQRPELPPQRLPWVHRPQRCYPERVARAACRCLRLMVPATERNPFGVGCAADALPRVGAQRANPGLWCVTPSAYRPQGPTAKPTFFQSHDGLSEPTNLPHTPCLATQTCTSGSPCGASIIEAILPARDRAAQERTERSGGVG